jgi:DNA-binding Xre family transcriptional regulator
MTDDHRGRDAMSTALRTKLSERAGIDIRTTSILGDMSFSTISLRTL